MTQAPVSRLGTAAAWYAAKRWPVFPLLPRNKTPLTAHGVHDATTDSATVTSWWEAEPNANIAIAMGAPSGLFAVDIDGEVGTKTLAGLELQHGSLPPTIEAVTARGRHLLFKLPADVEIRNSAGKIGLGIDVRGAGGYIVVAPSVHPCGTPYQWRAGRKPNEVEPADPPDWLLRLLAKRETPRTNGAGAGAAPDARMSNYVAAALADELAAVAAAPEGRRNDQLNLSAFALGTLAGAGMLERVVVERSLAGAAAATGLDCREAAATIKSGVAAGILKPREIPEQRQTTNGTTSNSSGPAPTAKEGGGARRRGPTQADILIELADEAEPFHAPDGTGFADVDINGHRETWPVRSKGFRRWLVRRYFEATGGAPSSEALQSALNVIEAKAQFDAPGRAVHIRVGELEGRLFLDLGDETWRAVEIGIDGWRVIDNPAVRFRRASGMQSLPAPVAGGSVEALRCFLNVQTDAHFVLVVAWVLAVLRNRGPFPVLVLSGEQGSAKSTFSAILRALLDPNVAPLRALPQEDRDLFIAASNGHVLAFDNVSGLPAWISDTLCRLATGGGFAVRQLYTDQDEVLFDAARPVILNGIEDMVTRPDLADRAIFLTLEPIPEERRRSEQELWVAFEKERPRILGALLDAVVQGLKRLSQIRLDKLPRMADFALWAIACETAFWPAGTFWAAYCGNRDEAVAGVIDADPVAAAVRAIMAARTEWTGTASDLLGALGAAAGETQRKNKTWPDSARALAGRLRRTASFLRKVGIEIGFDREGRARTRTIRITAAPENGGVGSSASSAPSVTRPKPNGSKGFPADAMRTVAEAADGRTDHADGGAGNIVRANPLKNNAADDADGADAKIGQHSGAGEEEEWTV